MEQTLVTSASSHSFPKWIVFVLGLLIGAGAGYGVFSYFAPSEGEIAEKIRLATEEQERQGQYSLYGTVESIMADILVVNAYSLQNELVPYTFYLTESTTFSSVGADESSYNSLGLEDITSGDRVTVKADSLVGNGEQPLTALEVLKF